MQRSFLIALVVLFPCVAPAFGWEEPVAARKPLKYWIDRLNDSDPKVRERAAEFLSDELWEFGLWETSFLDGETIKRRDAVRRQAKPLIPELLKALRSTDENVLLAAVVALMSLGPEAGAVLPDLERIVLDHETAAARMLTFYVLLSVTPENKPVGPIAMKILNSLPKETLRQLEIDDVENPSSKGNGEQSLSPEELRAASVRLSIPIFAGPLMISGHTKIEVPYLVEIALGDYPSTIRALAVSTLGALDFDAKSAVPALRKLLKDEDRFVRACAARSLLGIEQDPKLIALLVEGLELKGKEREEFEKEAREHIEQQALERKSWREIDGDDDILLKMCVQMMQHGSGFYRRQAIQHLGLIGPGAKSVIPELRKALRDPDEDTRRMAAEALKQIETRAPASSKN